MSEQTKKSSKRRSSRKSSKKRSKQPFSGLKGKKRKSSPAANFFAMVFGMITSLTLISLVISGFTAKKETDVTGKEAASPIAISDFDKCLTEGTEEEVVAYLKLLRRTPENITLPVQVERFQKQIKMADRLIDLQPSDLRKHMAIEMKIKASSQFYGLDFIHEMHHPNAKKHLESVVEYRDLDDDVIRREARLAISKLHVFEHLKQPSAETLEQANQSVFNVIDSFPGEKYVTDNVRLLILQMFKNDRENGVALMKKFFANYKDSENKGVQDLALELNDTLLLDAAEFKKLIKNRWADGEAGKQRLLETSLQLIENPDAGMMVIDRVATTQSWFEQIHDFENAEKISTAMLENAQSHPVPEVSAIMLRHGSSGLNRLAMVGQPIELVGHTPTGPLSAMGGRIVAVVFFRNDKRSTRTVSNLLKLEKEIGSKGIELLGCCMEHDLGKTITKLTNEFPSFPVVMADDSAMPTNQLLEQYPVVRTPHTILVDHKGVVRRINVQLADIRTHIESLLAEIRREQAEEK